MFILNLQDLFESVLSLEFHGEKMTENQIPPMVLWCLSSSHQPEHSSMSTVSTVWGPFCRESLWMFPPQHYKDEFLESGQKHVAHPEDKANHLVNNGKEDYQYYLIPTN